MQHHTTFDYRRQQYVYRSICQPSLQICLARTAWNRTSQAPPTWWCDEESGFVFRSVKVGLLQLFAGRCPWKQAGPPAESRKQCSSSCPWQTRARPLKAFTQIPPLVVNRSSYWVQDFHPVPCKQIFILSFVRVSSSRCLSTFPLSAFHRRSTWSHECPTL